MKDTVVKPVVKKEKFQKRTHFVGLLRDDRESNYVFVTY